MFTYSRFTNYIKNIQIKLGVAMLCVFLVSILIQIGVRFLSLSAMWTEEMANYSFIWAVFMGASVMVHEKAHFRFGGLLDFFSKKNRLRIELTTNALMLAFSLGMFYYGVKASELFWNYTWVTIPGLKKGYLWLSLPVAGLTISLYLVEQIAALVAEIRGKAAKGE
jgi:TRAP-type C4-dicarboxylate transport system permease small subunit